MIPKVIHYCWFGRNPVPKELQVCMDSWKRVMPDYEIKLWNEDNYDVSKCAYMKEAYDAKKWAFVSDYARLDILYEHGGIYLDADVEAVRSFDDLLTLEAFCGFEEGKSEEPLCVNPGLGIGCVKSCNIVCILRGNYHSLHFRKADGSNDLTTVPVIVTEKLKECGLQQVNIRQNVNGLEVFPSEYFCPMNQYTGKINITPNTYSIHHYSASWMDPADQERRKLRTKYSYMGKLGSDIVSSLVAYGKHYGLIGMWGHIFNKLIKKIRDGNN